MLPEGAPRLAGLLRMDLTVPRIASPSLMRIRWFPEPSPGRAVPNTPESTGTWETRLAFELAWTVPEDDTSDALWPLHEPKPYDYDRFFPAGYNDDGFDDFHRLLGHKTCGLDALYAFTPTPGCPEDLDDYELLLRITYDNEAGFAWGTNWIYLLVPREDLARADLSRVVMTAANS